MDCVDLADGQTVEDSVLGDLLNHALQQACFRTSAPLSCSERPAVDREFRADWIGGDDG